MGTPKETKTFDANQLAEWSQRLRIVASRIENAADVLRENGGEVQIANWKSGELGIKNFLAFSTAIHQSIDEMLFKLPQQSKRTKPQKKMT